MAATSGFFGLAGLLLAGIGLFGVAASAVAYRTSELGLRLALGASRWRIVAQLFSEALVLAGVAALLAVLLVSAGLTQLDAAIASLPFTLPFWTRT